MQCPPRAEFLWMPSVLLNASCGFCGRAKNAQNARHRCSLGTQVVAYYFYACPEGAPGAELQSDPTADSAALLQNTPPQRLKTRRRSAKKTMQAATLVALLIPVVAIWITVVVATAGPSR